jgi:two-component system, cell cycle sensor histidine kinase and response regulator CckA
MTMSDHPTHEELERTDQEPKDEPAGHSRIGEALSGSEILYRTLFDSVGDAIFLMEGDRFLDCNGKTLEMFRCSREDILGHTPYAYSPPTQPDGQDSRTKALYYINQATKGIPQFFEWTHLRADGTTFAAEVSLNAAELSTGIYIQAVVRDITWREQAESRFKESEDKCRLVVENTNDAIYIVQDERIHLANPKAVEIFGYSEEELDSVSPHDLIHPDDRDRVRESQRERLDGRTPRGDCEFRIISKAGNAIQVSLNTVPITWEGKPATLNFLRDMTQQREWDKQTHQIERTVAIGTLAGGMANNFNNTLMGIQGRASLLMMDKDPGHPDYKHLKGIEEHVRSASELTKDLLAFAQSGKSEAEPTDMNDLIRHENRMFSTTKKDVRITEDFEQGLWNVVVDQSQMRQMLMNLYVNAWQAMPAGGELHVQTENAVLTEEHGEVPEGASGRYVKISISDTGIGMDPAVQKKIFDPFFTTREPGSGTGLGLASVYGIVRNHGGFIHVSSGKGRGTTFTISLPASEKPVVEEKKPSEEIVKEADGTILLVDDEKMILDVGALLLNQLGYTVITADNGKDAVEQLLRHRGEIDLVLLDMIMPGMSGGDTFDLLKEIDPNVKVILASGYSLEGQAQEIMERGCNGFIQKPFTVKELFRKIQDQLSG